MMGRWAGEEMKAEGNEDQEKKSKLMRKCGNLVNMVQENKAD